MTSTSNELLTVSLTLVRPGRKGAEIFWARRRADRDFLGGFHAFFAGGVEPNDRDLGDHAPRKKRADAHLRAAAVREAFEESGVLVTDEGIEHYRRAGRAPEVITEAADQLGLDQLDTLGWWTTPEWLGTSYITAFFGLRLTVEQGEKLDDLGQRLDEQEFETGEWIGAGEALERWWDGEVFLTEPIRKVIEAVADAPADLESLPMPDSFGSTRPEAGTLQLAQICGGLVMLPLETPTLPPATHTNCVIAGRNRYVVIDPGPADSDELAPLVEHLRKRDRRGHDCTGVVLTHHHDDHVGGVESIAEQLDVPVFAHPETLDRVAELTDLSTKPLADGDRIKLDHPGDLTALHTPGHAPGHLVFYQPDIDIVIGGDLVASRGTIVIAPPEGEMGAYLESLRRVRDLDPRALLPAHGQFVTRPVALLEEYVDHRKMREQKVVDALRDQQPARLLQLVPHVYDDAPKAVWPLAQRSLLAHLLDLEQQSRAARDDDGRWVLAGE